MSDAELPVRPRLVLVTPRDVGANFAGLLGRALSGGDVASVIIDCHGAEEGAIVDALRPLVAVAQAAGAAALVCGDTHFAGRVGADGVHLGPDAAVLRAAVDSIARRGAIVGAGGLETRHAAMEAGEAGADYVMFGRLGASDRPRPHARDLDLARWWAELFETPCVVLAGADPQSLAEAAATGAEFIALRDAVWSHPEGPAAAVAAANARLDAVAGAQA